jgi:methylenetetrahydrofolate reductase (NADPH)
MSKLESKVQSGGFVVTSELTPPKGTDLSDVLSKAQLLKPWVDALNVTESPRARMAIEPKAVAHLLLDQGVEPILQVTARDRNRIALQADLLGASVLGIENVVFMSGDSPSGGDHPEAKPVFDLFATEMLTMARALNDGRDMAGHPLKGAPRFYLGAVTNPGATEFAREVENTRRKIEAGAQFLQTQALYEASVLERFLDALKPDGVAVLAGIIPLKSAKMAHWLNDKVPGIRVPDALIEQMDKSAGTSAEVENGVEIAARVIRDVRPLCAGVHVMGLGWEDHIPAILNASGVRA